jgi:hypothetical protein
LHRYPCKLPASLTKYITIYIYCKNRGTKIGETPALSRDMSRDRGLDVGENFTGINEMKGKRIVEQQVHYLIMPGPILPPIRKAMLNIL